MTEKIELNFEKRNIRGTRKKFNIVSLKEDPLPKVHKMDIHCEDYLQLLKDILKKKVRGPGENSLIKKHFYSMSAFCNFLNEIKVDDINGILKNLAELAQYRESERNRVLFRCGELGEKLYLLLKGKVDVLIPNELKVKLQEGDYVYYLLKLRVYEEFDLLNLTIEKNRSIFHIDFNCLDLYIKKFFDFVKEVMDITDVNSMIFTDYEMRQIFESGNNKRYFTRSILYAMFSMESMEIYNRIKHLDDFIITFNYYELIKQYTGFCSEKFSKKNLLEIFRKSELETFVEEKPIVYESPIKHTKNIISLTAFQLDDDDNSDNDNENNSKTTDTNNLFKNVHFIEYKEYINRLKIKEFDKSKLTDQEKASYFEIFDYKYLRSLHNGTYFGEKALLDNLMKRTATIITSEKTHFAYVSKNVYDKSIRVYDEKLKKADLNCLLSSLLFSDINRNFFERKYFNFFMRKNIIRGEKLLTEGKILNAIFFIKSGKFDVTVRTSLNEFEKIIKTYILGGMNKEYTLRKYFFTNKDDLTSKDINLEAKEHDHSVLYQKFKVFFDNKFPFGEIESNKKLRDYMDKKRNFYITSLSTSEIIGLEDFISNDNYTFTITCMSEKAKYFQLNFDFLEHLCKLGKITKMSYEKLLNIKREVLIDRMINVRKVLIDKFLYEEKLKKDEDNKIHLKKVLNDVNAELTDGQKLKAFSEKELEIACSPRKNKLNFINNIQEIMIKQTISDAMYNKPQVSLSQKIKKNKKEKDYNLYYTDKKPIDNNLKESFMNYNSLDLKNQQNFNDTELNLNFNNSNLFKTSIDKSSDLKNIFSKESNFKEKSKNLRYKNIPIFNVDFSSNFINTTKNDSNNLNTTAVNNSSNNTNKILNTINSPRGRSFNTMDKLEKIGKEKSSSSKNIKNSQNSSNKKFEKNEKMTIFINENSKDKNKTVSNSSYEYDEKLPKISNSNTKFLPKNTKNEEIKMEKFSTTVGINGKYLTTKNNKKFKNPKQTFSNTKEKTTVSEIINSNSNYNYNQTTNLNATKCTNTQNNLKTNSIVNIVENMDKKSKYDNSDLIRSNRNFLLNNENIESFNSQKDLEVLDDEQIFSNLYGYKPYDIKMNNLNFSSKGKSFFHTRKISELDLDTLDKDEKNRTACKLNKLQIHFNSEEKSNNKSKSFFKQTVKGNNSNFNNTISKKIMTDIMMSTKQTKNSSNREPELEKYDINQSTDNKMYTTMDIIKKGKITKFESKESIKNKKNEKYFSTKYNINSHSNMKNNNQFDINQFFDEIELCRMLDNNFIDISNIDKLNLIPNFNMQYFYRLRNKEQENKFNNPLLENFKPNNYLENNENSNEDIGRMINLTEEINVSENINNLNYYYSKENKEEVQYAEKEMNTEKNEEIIVKEKDNEKQIKNLSEESNKEYEKKILKENKEKNNKDKNCKLENKKSLESSKIQLLNNLHQKPKLGSYNFNTMNSSKNTESLLSDNFGKNFGFSNLDNRTSLKNTKILYDQSNMEFEEETKIIPYCWGTKYAISPLAVKTFVNLNNNIARNESLKANLVPDCIIDQGKVNAKKRENKIKNDLKRSIPISQSKLKILMKNKKKYSNVI